MKKALLTLVITSVAFALPLTAFAQTNQQPVPPPLTVTCTSSAQAGRVSFNALASGGTGTYTYQWTANGSVATSSPTNYNSSVFSFPVNDQTPESAVVAVTDGQSNATASCPAVSAIIQPIVGYCSVEVLPAYYSATQQTVGRTVNYKVAVGGGNGTYSYVWTGSDGLFGTTQDVNQIYTTPGLKSGTVTITSGNQTAQLTCSANLVNVAPDTNQNAPTLGGSCSLSTQTPSTQQPVTWIGETEGVSSSTVAWLGDASGSALDDTIQYSTPGLRSGVFTQTTADGQDLSLTCQALLSSTTVTVSGTNGCFIATAAWGTQDAPEVVALRQFRDDKLLTTTLGSDFVNAYYAVSPPIADVIRDSSPLKWIVRMLLKPVVYVTQQIDQK